MARLIRAKPNINKLTWDNTIKLCIQHDIPADVGCVARNYVVRSLPEYCPMIVGGKTTINGPMGVPVR